MSDQASASTLVYVGTYTETLPFVEANADGIYHLVDLAEGVWTLTIELFGLPM